MCTNFPKQCMLIIYLRPKSFWRVSWWKKQILTIENKYSPFLLEIPNQHPKPWDTWFCFCFSKQWRMATDNPWPLYWPQWARRDHIKETSPSNLLAVLLFDLWNVVERKSSSPFPAVAGISGSNDAQAA